MKNATIIYVFCLFLFFLGHAALEAKSAPNDGKYTYCVGGDAIDHADITVESISKEDIVHLDLVTGQSDDEKENLKRSYTAHLAKGSFQKMFKAGKIEMIMNSNKHPETAFGGETSFAALVDLSRRKDGDFHGFVALDGSVFELSCPRDPEKYFGGKS